MTPATDDSSVDDLRVTIMRLSRRVRLERASDGVTDGQLAVLFVLWKEGPQTLGSLSEHERVTPPAMNRTVNALVEASLITRTSAPDDGRKVVITLTDAGLTIATETKRRRRDWFAKRLAGLSDADRATLLAAAPILRELAGS